MKAVIHREEVPAGTAFREWRNITGGWLQLEPPGLRPVNIRPDGRLQIPCEDLAAATLLEPWPEGLELAGTLHRSA